MAIMHLNSKFSSFHTVKCTHELFDKMLPLVKGIHSTMHAHQVPDEMADRGYRPQNALIRSCMMNHQYSQAVVVFHQMHCTELRPDWLALAAVIKSSAVLLFHGFGRSLHGFAMKGAYAVIPAVAKALIDMYARFDAVHESHRIFSEMDQKDSVSWNVLLSGYARAKLNLQVINLFHLMHAQKDEDAKPTAITIAVVLPVCVKMRTLKAGQSVHAYAIRTGLESETLVGNALLSMYAKCGNVVDEAQYLFDHIVHKDVISWNSMISGYSEQGFFAEAFLVFKQMVSRNFAPNHATVATVLPICALVENSDHHGKQIHCYVLRCGLEKDLSASNALLIYYSKMGDMSIAESIFKNMQVRDLISWNTMITGCAMNGCPMSALGLLHELLLTGTEPDPITLLGILSACGQLHNVNEGKKIHAYVLQHPKLSWNLMLQVYAQHDFNDRAICLFREFQAKGMRPDAMSILSILPACARLASVYLVKQCHGYKIRASFNDLQLEGALLDTYSKCGSVNDAHKLFQTSSQKDLVMFTAMISCYAMHGMAGEALRIFSHMLELNIKPDHVILTTLLSACSHAGLVDEGWKLFKSINETFGIKPTMEHYACMVDLLARRGRLREAYEFIMDMPCKPNASVWGSLLGACKTHGDVEVGKLAADNLFNIEGGNIGNYVVMSNIYAAGRRWDDVERMRKLMKGKDLNKPAGCSWIEVDDKRHVFVAADLSHPNRFSIYDMLVTSV